MTGVAESDDVGEYNMEYSFALEYGGPSLSCDIPQVVPVDVDGIPTTAAVAKASVLNNLSVSAVQPLVKSSDSRKKMFKLSKAEPEVANSPASPGNLSEFGESTGVLSYELHGFSNEGGFSFEENGSSDTPGFSDSQEDSNEFSGSSDVKDFNVGREEAELEKPSVSTPAAFSEVSSSEGMVEDWGNNAAGQGNRTLVVTFHDHSLNGSSGESDHDHETENIHERAVARSKVKKGLCYRCLKGNRFTGKEVCIVCGAKYCRNCVLRAMGSMPEGRKCITCIGFGINESKRGSLGKCSKMLKRMLSKWEVERIMSSEVSCKVNQLQPHLILVNGKQLSVDELVKLQSCKYPPKKLKPGTYWYDNLSGFWGKEGKKPWQMISPQLSVGGQLRQDASNGNTNVLLNGRAVNKPELLLLKFAGLCTEGSPSYWLSPDGSYQEEGQKNVMVQKWDNIGFKLLATLLSFPVPPESYCPCAEMVDGVDDKNKRKNQQQDPQSKLLLVGCDQSGTSTLFKQAKFILNVPFSEDELQSIKFMIQRNLYTYLAILLEGLGKYEEDYLTEMRQHIEQPGPSEMPKQFGLGNIYSTCPRLKAFSDWLLRVNMSGSLDAIFPAATREYAPLVEELWKDKAFQAIYSQRNELCTLPRVADYFLDRAVEISRADYEPSFTDILYADGISSSSGVASVEFSLPESSQEGYTESVDHDDPSRRYQLIRVPPRSLGKNGKWLGMFEDVELVIHCISLTDYAEFFEDTNGFCTNKMLASRTFFEKIVTHPTFAQKNFLLILSKFDLLQEMMEKVPLTECDWFDDFSPIAIHHSYARKGKSTSSPAQRAFHYIAAKFKRLFTSLTGRKLYVAPVTGLEPDSVDKVLKYGVEIVKWEEERATFNVTDQWSSVSIEEASTIS